MQKVKEDYKSISTDVEVHQNTIKYTNQESLKLLPTVGE